MLSVKNSAPLNSLFYTLIIIYTRDGIPLIGTYYLLLFISHYKIFVLNRQTPSCS